MSVLIEFLRRIGGTKAPPTNGTEGQVAIYKAGKSSNDATSLYFHDGMQWVELLDTRGQVASPKITTFGSASPTTPALGDMWLNTATNLLSIWNGTAWASTDTHLVASGAKPAAPSTGMLWINNASANGALWMWDGTDWARVAFMERENTFFQPQLVQTSSTKAALQVVQTGSGPALLVEDETSPDGTPFTVDASGNVGIGLAAPTEKLDVVGTALIAANHATKPALRVSQIGNGPALLVEDEGNPDGTPFVVDKDGNVGIGLAAPTAKLDVAGTARVGVDLSVGGHIGVGTRTPAAFVDVVGAGVAFKQTSGAKSIAVFTDGTYGYTQFNGPFVFQLTTPNDIMFQTSAVTQLSIKGATGQLVSGPTYTITGAGTAVNIASDGSIFRSSSSIKYKKDVEALDPAITDRAVAGLRPVWYRTKNPAGDDKAEWSHIGLIAEEVAKVEPRLVKYKTVEVTHDDDGNPVVTPLATPEPEDVDYARLSVLLLDYVQRLEKRVAVLEARP